MLAETSDEDLAVAAARGDGAAFRRLLERHYDRVFRLAYRFFGSRPEAEDAAQEICLALAGKIKAFGGRSRFATWLYAVAVNACRDRKRRQWTALRHESAFVEERERREADWADSEGRARWLYRALDGLDPALKETALLVLAEEMSHAEAGKVLGVKENTVSWRMHEVKKRLKAMAKDD
jgi:RNA polymerase sigma-70 factor (ECF subfamily)